MLQNCWLLRGLLRARECPRAVPALAGTQSSPGRRRFRSTASTGTPTGACSGSTSHTSGNPLAARGAERRVTQTAGQPIRWTPKTLNLLLSLLPTSISKSHRVWVKTPLLGITAERSVVTTAALPHLLLATHPHSLPCCGMAYQKHLTQLTKLRCCGVRQIRRNTGLRVCFVCENESPTLSRKQNPTLSGAPRQLSKLCRKILQETGEETKCSSEQAAVGVFNRYRKSVS